MRASQSTWMAADASQLTGRRIQGDVRPAPVVDLSSSGDSSQDESLVRRDSNLDVEMALLGQRPSHSTSARKSASAQALANALFARPDVLDLANDDDDDDSLDGNSASDASSSSSDSLELDSGASTSSARPSSPAPTPRRDVLPPAPAAFRTPVRPARARQATHVAVGSPPKVPHAGVDAAAVSHDYPLPHPPFEFDILNHAPARHPVPPPGWKEPLLRTDDENVAAAAREADRRRRVEEQRRLREGEGSEWEWTWERDEAAILLTDWKGKGKARESTTDFRSAAFFPHAHLPGLSYMSGVLAVVGGSKVDLLRLDDASTSSNSASLMQLASHTSRAAFDPKHRDHEEYLTCAWSVNITTHPYTPMLAVAGRGRVIDVFLVGQHAATGEWMLHKDRTITGHGGTIHHLTFHPSYLHLLASASEDKTLRLWDPTVPWGSDERVRRTLPKGGQRGATSRREEELRTAEGGRTSRPRVEGELLGVMAEGGHEKAVMSCDFHATLSLVVSAGNDGFIRLWQLPQSVLAATPFWPDTPLFQHPLSPPPFSHAPMIDPPVFSSYAIHPGQWPDQVLFASPTTCTILSKAPVTHADARFSPRTSVKLWTPTVLDVLPSRAGDARAAAVERTRSLAHAQGPHTVPSLVAPRAALPPNARSDGGFRVLYEAVVESQNCVGDSVGWYRPGPRSPASAHGGPQEPFFVLGTATPLPVGTAFSNDEALYFFRPFAPVPLGTAPAASSAGRPSVLTSSVATNGSSRRRATAKARSAELDAAAQALFPPDRDRTLHDFTPRLLPSAVADVLPPGDRRRALEGRQAVHWRALAVSADGKDVVAVGDGGAVAVFRGRRRARARGGGDAMEE